MSDLELQNKALNNKIRRLEYRLHIYRGINEDLLKQNAQLSRELKRATETAKTTDKELVK